MARKNKIGLEYAPQDVNIHNDRKIRRLLTEFGATGYLVYDYIKCLCYNENGYWMKYDEGFCFDVADVLKSGTTENSVLEILKGCFRMSLFDSEVFKAFRIITSAGIQKRFLEVRPKVKIRDDINLIIEESTENSPDGTKNDGIGTENGTNGTENNDLVHKVKESKVKESKVKESKEAFKALLEPYRKIYGDAMMVDFLQYWGEAQPSGRLKYQLEDTWELDLRLRRWHRNQDKFNKK